MNQRNTTPPPPAGLNREEDLKKEALAVPGSLAEVPNTRLDDIIRAREEGFFRELVAEEHKGSHPLMHMVASQQKLHSIGVPIHQLDPQAAVKKFKKTAKMSPYERPQTLVEYTERVDARSRRLYAARNTHMPGEPRDDTGGTSGDKVSSSATRHRQFLDKTLSAVHEQLESTALAETTLSNPRGGGA